MNLERMEIRVNVKIPENLRRQQRLHEQRKVAAKAACGQLKERTRPLFDAVHAWADRISRDPAWLDLCMRNGVYEEHLAESHGDCEDVWV